MFAYGATGAGKTYTMLGSEQSPGIMYLTMAELYRRIEARRDEKSCEVLVSYQEVCVFPMCFGAAADPVALQYAGDACCPIWIRAHQTGGELVLLVPAMQRMGSFSASPSRRGACSLHSNLKGLCRRSGSAVTCK